MYQQGDKIVYPLYGAGIIEEIIQQEFDGAVHTYYALNIPIGNLKIQISAAKTSELGVRYVLPLRNILLDLHQSIKTVLPQPENWNVRYKQNIERMKTGNILDVASVYNELLRRERSRGLSTAEKKMLTTAKQIILSELVLAMDAERNEAEDVLNSIFVTPTEN